MQYSFTINCENIASLFYHSIVFEQNGMVVKCPPFHKKIRQQDTSLKLDTSSSVGQEDHCQHTASLRNINWGYCQLFHNNDSSLRLNLEDD